MVRKMDLRHFQEYVWPHNLFALTVYEVFPMLTWALELSPLSWALKCFNPIFASKFKKSSHGSVADNDANILALSSMHGLELQIFYPVHYLHPGAEIEFVL